jgi:hypothetical protein
VSSQSADLIEQTHLGLRGIEYPSIRAFALAPGIVPTRLVMESQAGHAPDTVALPAATILYLTSGRVDWLSGRFVRGVKGAAFYRAYRWTGIIRRIGI